MFLSAYLTIVLSQLPVDVRAGENPLTNVELRSAPAALTFSWSDTEDTLRGTLSPTPLKARLPFTVSASVEPIAGDEFEGPITFSLRPLKEMGSTQSVTVTRKKEQKLWLTELEVEEAGDYRFEVSWRSTHHKVVRSVVSIGPPGFPGWVRWTLGIGLVVLAVGIGMWIVLSRKES